jgi:hypothetical protein
MNRPEGAARGAALLMSAVVLLVVGLWARPAAAYPQFQFSSGTQRCAQCHYSPAGFGLLTSWGRDEGADTISRGGDGAFLHGAWTPPDWLALGGDFRFAALRNDSGAAPGAETALFPMQAELYARAGFGDTGLSIYVAGGFRGVTRPDQVMGSVKLTDRVESLMSREHYLMWKPSATGAYVRAGRFYAPYGLRMAEHIYYVRSKTGFDLYEETYNLSGGYLAENWELHLTAFTPPPSSFPLALRSTATQTGGAAYAEKRFNSNAALALQARYGHGKDHSITQGGVVGKYWLDDAKVLFMGELDIQRDAPASGPGSNQLVAYLGPTFIPVKGLMAALALERYQTDLTVAGTAHTAVDLQVNYFPWAHCEFVLLGRYQMSGSGPSDGATDTLGLLQFHYYL